MAPGSIRDLKERIRPLREQAEITDNWLGKRLQVILPGLMEREGIDLWVVIARENNEDPVILSLMPATILSARRRTILVFHRNKKGEVDCLNLGKPDPGLNRFYKQAWDPQKEGQWEALARKIGDLRPGTLGINVSGEFAFGDGLSSSQKEEFLQILGTDSGVEIKSAAKLALGWLEKRTPEEIIAYEGINRIAHEIIARAYSSQVIHPGITCAVDVAWWMRQTINDIGLQAWFQPTVDIQRAGEETPGPDSVILPGDVLHCDMGLCYLGLATDTQQMAYILRPGETSPPREIAEALNTCNRLQDIFAANFIEGRTGNEIFQKSLQQAGQEGITAMIYTHPIGYHGHGAGPTMGLFDQQTFIPGPGEYPLYKDTCYAVELNIKEKISAWKDKEIMIALEQTAVFTNGKVEYLGGRQKEFFCI